MESPIAAKKWILETTGVCVCAIKLNKWVLQNPRCVKTLVIELKVGIKRAQLLKNYEYSN